MTSLCITERQMIAAKTKFDGVTKRSAPDDLDAGAIAEAHFQQAPPHFRLAADRNNHSAASNAKLIQSTSFDRSAMIAAGQVTCLLHSVSALQEPADLANSTL